MINCNPETVSTDYDTSDRLYFEPLTCEDVLEVVNAEQRQGSVVGVIVQLGGQTPLGLAQRLEDAGVPIVGTSPAAIHLAEEQGLRPRAGGRWRGSRPRNGAIVRRGGGYRSSRRLSRARSPELCTSGGRGMEIVYDDAMLESYLQRSTEVTREHPVLVDRFLDDAIEIDVDALFDGHDMYLAGVMEHIEGGHPLG